MKTVRSFKPAALAVLASAMTLLIANAATAAVAAWSFWPNSLHGDVTFKQTGRDGNHASIVAHEIAHTQTTVRGLLICSNGGKNNYAAPGIQIRNVYESDIEEEIIFDFGDINIVTEGTRKGGEYTVSNLVTSVIPADPYTQTNIYSEDLQAICPNGHTPTLYISLAVEIVSSEYNLTSAEDTVENSQKFYLDICTPLTWYWDEAAKKAFFEKRYYSKDSAPSCPAP